MVVRHYYYFGFCPAVWQFLTDIGHFLGFLGGNITKLYYGQVLPHVSLYSNSWFAYSGPALAELRMFSIMPDSQSFAYICFFALCMGTALTRNVFKHIKKWLWSGIRFAGLGLDSFRHPRGLGGHGRAVFGRGRGLPQKFPKTFGEKIFLAVYYYFYFVCRFAVY